MKNCLKIFFNFCFCNTSNLSLKSYGTHCVHQFGQGKFQNGLLYNFAHPGEKKRTETTSLHPCTPSPEARRIFSNLARNDPPITHIIRVKNEFAATLVFGVFHGPGGQTIVSDGEIGIRCLNKHAQYNRFVRVDWLYIINIISSVEMTCEMRNSTGGGARIRERVQEKGFHRATKLH